MCRIDPGRSDPLQSRDASAAVPPAGGSASIHGNLLVLSSTYANGWEDRTMTGEEVGEDPVVTPRERQSARERRFARERSSRGNPPADHEWVELLSSTGRRRDEAVGHLHDLLLRATRHQVNRMPEAITLGVSVREELINTAADEATLSVLGKLDDFEGRSRFTTWAYKFGILRAGVEVRRHVWRNRELSLDDDRTTFEPRTSHSSSPDAHVEGRDLAVAVSNGLSEALTDHQRRVAVALLVDEVPIDILAERLDTTRNALYKTLHDARKRLRAHLVENGHAVPATAGARGTHGRPRPEGRSDGS